MKCLAVTAIVVAMLAASVDASAASCKFKQNTIDDFTQERLVRIDWVDMTGWTSSTFKRTIGHRKDIEIAAESVGGRSLLKFRLRLSDAVRKPPRESDLYSALYVPAGSGLEMEMADESIIELVVDKEVRGTNHAKYDDGWFVVTSKFVVKYPVDDALTERLAQEDVVYLRVAAQSRNYDFVSEQGTIEFHINEKAQRAFKKVFDCLQQAHAEDHA
ncbi:MAG: hypothetical protein OEQ14_15600 [Gammaproteobacteria bacterium]|nr:hypothetical protein [Gammaproteobacteria bacterium]